MHLVCKDHALETQSDRPGKSVPVLEHISPPVADMQADVESVEGRFAHAAKTRRKTCCDSEGVVQLIKRHEGRPAGFHYAPHALSNLLAP
jgi:hypothetical protein